jgi:hypothetical protein
LTDRQQKTYSFPAFQTLAGGLRCFDIAFRVSEKIGREINSHIMTRDEFKKRRSAKEHFLASVINSPKLFVVGTEDALKTMA